MVFVLVWIASSLVVNTQKISYAEAPITNATTQQTDHTTLIRRTIDRYATLYKYENTALLFDLVGIESSFCTNNVNKTSSARGCFMIIKSTWEYFECSGDRMSIEDNIQCGVKIMSSPNGLKHWTADKNTKRKLIALGYDVE